MSENLTSSINIALSTDARGHDINATLIASIMRRTQWNVQIRCWCVGFLPESFEVGKLKVEFLPASGDHANKYPSQSGPAAYDRLLVIRDCPDWDRCMVMDYDQLVLCDLSPLFELDLGDHLLAAHIQGPGIDMDYAMRVWLKRPMPVGWEHCGTHPYFLMPPMMNLKAMREAGTWETFLQAHAAFGADEQLSLTAATEGRTLAIDKKWNLFPRLHIAKNEVPQGVIHWSGWPKPWHKNADVWRPDIWEAERSSWQHLRMGLWEKPEVWEIEPEDDHGMKGLLERGWKVWVSSSRLTQGKVKNGGYPDLLPIPPDHHENKNTTIPQWLRFGQWVDVNSWLENWMEKRRTEVRAPHDSLPEYVTLKGPLTNAEMQMIQKLGYGLATRFRSHEWPAGGPMPRVMRYEASAWQAPLAAGEELIAFFNGEKNNNHIDLTTHATPQPCRTHCQCHPLEDHDHNESPVRHDRKKVSVCLFVADGEEAFAELALRALTRNFLPNHERNFLVVYQGNSSDFFPEETAQCKVIREQIDHRYAILHKHRQTWEHADYIYCIEATLIARQPIGDEIFSDLVAVTHPGFHQQERARFTYEKRPHCTAYVAPHEGSIYYSNRFQGGTVAAYRAAIETICPRWEQDNLRNICAIWREESHWNRYLIDQVPSLTLSPAYAWTQAVAKEYDGILVQLPKSAFALSM